MTTVTTTWVWIIFAIGFASGMENGEDMLIHRFKRVCYLTHESLGRHNPAGKFKLSMRSVQDDIPANMCTHIIYAFAKLDVGNFTIRPGKNDAIPGGNYDIINSLKGSGSSPKTLLSIGGPNTKPKDFEKIARDDDILKPFVYNLINFLRFHNFNGIEIDWQYPADIVDPENPNAGKSLFIGLLSSIKKAFVQEGRKHDRSRLLLSVATGVSARHLEKSYNFPMLTSLADFITIRSCDYHGSWDKKTGMNSPLYPAYNGDSQNIASTVGTIVNQGGRPDKLVITLCAKGSSYTMLSDKDTNIESDTSGPGIQGPFVQKLGSMAYFEVCVILREKGTRMWQNIQKNPYVIRDRLWIGYDDVESIELKAEWIVKQKLGGAALWSLDLDDFQGRFCKKGKYPLAMAMKAILTKADRKFFDIAFGSEDNEIDPISAKKEEIRELAPIVPQRFVPNDVHPSRRLPMNIQNERPNFQVLIPERPDMQRPLPGKRPDEAFQAPKVPLALISIERLDQGEEFIIKDKPVSVSDSIENKDLMPMQDETVETVTEQETEDSNDEEGDIESLGENDDSELEDGDQIAVEGVNEKLKDSGESLRFSVCILLVGYVFSLVL